MIPQSILPVKFISCCQPTQSRHYNPSFHSAYKAHFMLCSCWLMRDYISDQSDGNRPACSLRSFELPSIPSSFYSVSFAYSIWKAIPRDLWILAKYFVFLVSTQEFPKPGVGVGCPVNVCWCNIVMVCCVRECFCMIELLTDVLTCTVATASVLKPFCVFWMQL